MTELARFLLRKAKATKNGYFLDSLIASLCRLMGLIFMARHSVLEFYLVLSCARAVSMSDVIVRLIENESVIVWVWG